MRTCRPKCQGDHVSRYEKEEICVAGLEILRISPSVGSGLGMVLSV